ncbi:chromate efflux transporter [Lipingzhangella sp. LS1_29]|uniref:Chromate efflux transporter n=1 Tax=Lipingzhangella rawalii TaxID=2055835 RepID=A0ABU2H484_9ACTN|nr:chromate efflux transporter [Lipingzhangella rawalii]MDS1270117.1 chromate efflux transporter [Lipingzhangella rawalii]
MTEQPGPGGRDPAERSGDAARSGTDLVPFRSAVRTWFLISLQTFGGPAGQIAVMQRVLVEERRWIGQRRFNHALNYCMLLPGPEAQQLATYVGWLLNGVRGGLVAGVLFVLPGVAALLGLSVLYVAYGDTRIVTALFAGLAPAVLAIVAQALLRIGRRILTHVSLAGIGLAAFVALALFNVPFPVVVLGAGVAGYLVSRLLPHAVVGTGTAGAGDGEADGRAPVVADDVLHRAVPGWRRNVRVLAVGLTCWVGPPLAIAAATGVGSVFTTQAVFFSAAALVTFGGAYAVLAFVAQQAVEVYGWLHPTEMVRGLAFAETTPGPLIMVVQFVAFLGAYRDPGALDPWVAAVVGALVVTWVTFAPSFLFIFLGAPYVERLRGNTGLSAALTGITAAVVGVIANLALYFAVHTLFTEVRELTWGPLRLELPQLASVQPVPVLVGLAAMGMVFVLRWSILRTLAVSAVLGVVVSLASGPITGLF